MVISQPSFEDTSGVRRSYLQSHSRSVSFSREHSPESHEERTEMVIHETVERHLSPPRAPRRRRSSAEIREANESLRSLHADEENMHGSSEFMLVLYPDEEDGHHEGTKLDKESGGTHDAAVSKSLFRECIFLNI